MKLFEEANKVMPGQWYLNGFAVGSAVQLATFSLLKLNLANHNYKLGDKET
jgi:hypothetical protein